jgi:hypothetical protein
MKSSFRRRRARTSSEEGQTFIPIAVLILMLLLGMLGVAIDYSQLWAHRQMAQGAADAACQAGAADIFLNAIDPAASGQNGLQSFNWIGNPFDCSTQSGTPPCQYALKNGYSGSAVSVSFPSSLPNVPALTGPFTTATPYIQVTVSDSVPMTLTQLFSPNPTVTIHATAGCGLVPVSLPTPLVILHQSAAGALSVSGASKITVFGGPQRSVEVNSKAAAAVSVGSVDLSQGGPNDTGSDFAVFGGPQTQPAGILLGSTGHYLSPALPLGDPFATVNPPAVPATLGTASAVPLSVNGCPDPNGCVEFTPGNYTGCTASGNIAPGAQGCLLLPYTGSNPKFKTVGQPDWVAKHAYTAGTLVQPTKNNNGNYVFIATSSGTSGNSSPAWPQTPCSRQAAGNCTGQTVADGPVVWQNVGVVTLNKLQTGIFDPGVYYVAANGFNLGDQSTARVSTATGDGSKGVMFYFSTSATVGVTSNSGKSAACTAAANTGAANPNGCVVSYPISGALSSQATGAVASQKLQCPTGSANPLQVPAVLDGNILLGPCSGTYASPDGNRGFLFFQNRATSATPSWGGGGQFLSSGFLYFHSGNGATCGTGTTCLTLQGGSGAQSYTLGNIVVDELALGGNPQINMILNPTATFQVLKPTLLE